MTVRFAKSHVTYRLDEEYPSRYLDVIRLAFAFVADRTGLTIVETHGPADIVIVGKSDGGAHTSVSAPAGSIQAVKLQLGCCSTRPAFEDILQSFGPLGDRAGPDSLFSQPPFVVETPSAFDGWVLSLLYSIPPGSSAATVRAAAVTKPASFGPVSADSGQFWAHFRARSWRRAPSGAQVQMPV